MDMESPPKEIRKSALMQAQAIIYGDREQAYGSPDKNLKVIAEYWTTHLNASYGKNLRLTVDDVCGMMVLLKQARLANSPKHEDSLVDLIGYAALKDRCDHLEVASTVAPKVPAAEIAPPLQCRRKHTSLLCTYPQCTCSTI